MTAVSGSDSKTDIKAWLERVKSARSRKEIFAILDEFRDGEWTDGERVQMSHLYMRMIEIVGGSDDESPVTGNGASPEKGEDGPVWYEKM